MWEVMENGFLVLWSGTKKEYEIQPENLRNPNILKEMEYFLETGYDEFKAKYDEAIEIINSKTNK